MRELWLDALDLGLTEQQICRLLQIVWAEILTYPHVATDGSGGGSAAVSVYEAGRVVLVDSVLSRYNSATDVLEPTDVEKALYNQQGIMRLSHCLKWILGSVWTAVDWTNEKARKMRRIKIGLALIISWRQQQVI